MILKLMVLAVILAALILAIIGVFFEIYDRITYKRRINFEYIKTGLIIILGAVGLSLPIIKSLSDSPKRPIHIETKENNETEETTIVLNGNKYALIQED